MKQKKKQKKASLPASFRPILWGLKWDELNLDKDKEDIILAAINEGTLSQWRWLASTYRKDTIRNILEHRLASEIHPESLNLARIAFGVKHVRYARKRAHAYSKKVISSSRTI